MQCAAAKVLALMVGCFVFPEAMQLASPMGTKKQIMQQVPSLDLTPVNETVATLLQVIDQLNTTIGDMSVPVAAAVEQWNTNLGTIQDAVQAVTASSALLGGDDTVATTLTDLLPQLNASIQGATEKLPAATEKAQKALTKASSQLIELQDSVINALTTANEKVADLVNSSTSSGLFALAPKPHALVANRAAKRRASKEKAVKKQKRRMFLAAHRRKRKQTQHASLLETRAAQKVAAFSTVDRVVSKKGGKKGPEAFIADANKTIEKLSKTIGEINALAPTVFAQVATAVNGGLDSFNQTAQKALASAGAAVADAGGAQAAVAQTALGTMQTGLDTIITTVQTAVQTANSTGLDAVNTLVETANTNVAQLYTITASLQDQVAAAKNATD